MSKFLDRFGREWSIRTGGLRRQSVRARAIGDTNAVSIAGDQDRPGVFLILHGIDGRTVWSTWLPFRTLEEADEASGDVAFLHRIVDELYYNSQA